MAVRRFTTLMTVSIFAALVLFTAACTSGGSDAEGRTPTPSPTDSFDVMHDRVVNLELPFIQCLAQHNVPVWDRGQGDQNLAVVGREGGWYKNGRIVNKNRFWEIFEDLEGTYPMGSDFKPEQKVDDWLEQEARTLTWPKVCGPFPKVG